MPIAGGKHSHRWTEREALRNKGQFWTPGWVADAMAAYVCGAGDLVFDPAVGTGAFYEAVRRVAPDQGDRPRFYGIDVDPDIVAEAASALAADGERCRLERRDFILDTPEGPFSSIIANPPYIRHHRLPAELKNRLRSMSLRIASRRL